MMKLTFGESGSPRLSESTSSLARGGRRAVRTGSPWHARSAGRPSRRVAVSGTAIARKLSIQPSSSLG